MKPVNPRYSDVELKAILQAERTAALGTMASSDLSEQRIRALEYYMGTMDDMPTADGESSAVSSDVQDVVEGALPIILDVLTSSEDLAQFKPTSSADVEAAKQESDYVNLVFYQQNPGFMIMLQAVKDALLQKNGFITWWMEEEQGRTRESYKGLSEDSYALLTQDEANGDGKIIDANTYTAPNFLGQPEKFYDAIFEISSVKKRAMISAAAPEEILITKTARDLPNSSYWAHVQRKPEADVIALFPEKKDEIKKAPTATFSTVDNNEAQARQSVQDNADDALATENVNKAMRQIEVIKHFIRLNYEKDDDVARRYMITTTGTYEVLDCEEIDSWPIATGTPIPMPHRVIGRALADLAIDIQQIKTSLLRATLNNAYYANNARTEVSETHASENTLDDLMNNRVGGIVRTKMPGGLNVMEVQPIGHWTLGIIDKMDSIRENRTGISRYNQGLDADSLNHTATGVARIMDAAEMRLKLIARVLAETLVVDTFRGVHGMLQKYDEETHEEELRGQWVKVSPREWKTRRHMKVTLPLGGVSKQMMLQFFAQMLGVQKEIIQQQGSANGPLVSYQNVYATLERSVKLAGLEGVEPFFMKPPPPNPNAPPPPNPEMVKAQGQVQIAQAKQQADQQSNAQAMQFEQMMSVIQAKLDHAKEQDKFAHQQVLDRMKFQHEAQMESLHAGLEMRIKAFEAQQEAKLNAQQARLQAEKGVNNV